MCAPRVLALCLLAGLSRGAGAVAPPFVPRAPLPKPASKTAVSKAPLHNGVAPAQAVTAISRSPLKVFQEHAGPPIPFRFPAPLSRMQFKSKIDVLKTHRQSLSTIANSIFGWTIPQANPHQTKTSQITAAGNLLQWKLPEANKRLSNGIQITEGSRREQHRFKYNNRRKISDITANMEPQWRVMEAYRGLQKKPEVPDIINKKEPMKKSRPKIPRADMGMTFRPSTGHTKKQTETKTKTTKVIENAITKNVKLVSPQRPGAKAPVKVKSPNAKQKSTTPGMKNRRPMGPELPAHRNVTPKAVMPMSRPTLRDASVAPALRQREYNEPSVAEMKKLILKLMQQVLYTTQSDQLPVVEAAASRHAQDTRFRMAFIFLRLDELKHEMHTMYSYLMEKYKAYVNRGFYIPLFGTRVYPLRNRVHLTYYSHFVRRNVDITYSVEYLLELCKSTDRQMERLRQFLGLQTAATPARRRLSRATKLRRQQH